VAIAAEYECAIVGGGPAGAVLATRLAQLGHRVALFDAGRERGLPEETLLAGSERVFTALGLSGVLAACARADVARQGAAWEHADIVWRDEPAEGRGLRLPRAGLDAALRAHARACGADVFASHVVSGPLAPQAAVEVKPAAGAMWSVRADLWVVAAGRTFPHTLARRQEVAAEPDTAAITLRARVRSTFVDANVIEAVPEGWSWWLPLRDASTSVTLFVDAAELHARGQAALVASMLQHARGPMRAIAGAHPHAATRATARVHRALDDHVLLIGDAAAALDPLASQGIEKAISAGDAAAVAVHTALRQPRLRTAALAHHHAWELGVFAAHAEITRAFYRRQTRFLEAPFWRARRSPEPVPPTLPRALQTAPGLVAAPALIRVGDDLHEEPGFARTPEDVATSRIGRVLLAPLVHAFAQPRAVDAGVQLAAAHPEVFVLSPAVVHAAVAQAFARGYLVAAVGPRR
jgi:halogenation protein CepH